MAGAIATAVLVLLVAAGATPAVYAAQHVVGGNNGWTNDGTDYSTWASGQTFTVGDSLVFNYDRSTHQLAQVSESDYKSCSSSNSIKAYNDGSTTIPLSTAGTMYFICPTAGHCSFGMKLAVNVVAASSTTPSSPTTPATTTPSGSTTPSTPTTTTTTTTPTTSSNKSGASAILCNMMVLGSLLALGIIAAAGAFTF